MPLLRFAGAWCVAAAFVTTAYTAQANPVAAALAASTGAGAVVSCRLCMCVCGCWCGCLAGLQGLAPSQVEIAALKEESGGSVCLEDFKAFCSQVTHRSDSVEDLASVFALWDPNSTGFITKAQLKHVLGSFGEMLNPQELEFTLTVIAGQGDKVNYRDFCRK